MAERFVAHVHTDHTVEQMVDHIMQEPEHAHWESNGKIYVYYQHLNRVAFMATPENVEPLCDVCDDTGFVDDLDNDGGSVKCEWCPTPENVGCPKCHGVKRVCLNGHPHTDCPWTVDCPVCTENVGCQTCGGKREVWKGIAHCSPYPCPDCTPKNVECPTCGDSGTVYTRRGDDDWDVADCPHCPPPENVDTPT